MLNKENESIIKQEQKKLNKPHILIKIAHDRELAARDKKVYNIFIRELLTLNLKEYKNNEITMTLVELSKKLGVSTKNDLYKSIERLMKTLIRVEEVKGDKVFKTVSTMISSYTKPKEIDDDFPDIIDKLVIRFDTKLTRLILKNADKYAKLDLEDMSKLKISHALTLYEIFIRTLGTYKHQKVNYTEKELRTFLSLENKYLNIRDFTKAVIKKSINELNNKTQLDITFKREKNENKENVYKFEINQNYIYSFNRFKKCVIENYKELTFKYGKLELTISKDLEDKKSKYLIMNARTYKTLPEEKAKEIWNHLFELLNKDYREFTYLFLIEKDLNIKEIDKEDMDLYFEEAELFMSRYLETTI